MSRLTRKLDEAFGDRLPRGVPVHAKLDAGTRYDDEAGGLIGGVTIFVTTRTGDEKVAHSEPMSLLRNAEELDDWLARALSKFLEQHPKWPI